MVALSSCRVCNLYELGHACYVELSFHELVNQVAHSSVRWCRPTSQDSPLLFRIDLGRVYNRKSLDNLGSYRRYPYLRILGVVGRWLFFSRRLVESLLLNLAATRAGSG